MYAGKTAEHTAGCNDNLSRPYCGLNGIVDVFAAGKDGHCFDVESWADDISCSHTPIGVVHFPCG